VLLKASVVNALYTTNVFAIRATARHICDLFSVESELSDLQLVPRIAELAVGGKVRRCVSFASKYAHFFVDPDRFYIMDYNAGQALAAHLGARRVDPADWTPDYPAFVQRVEALRRRDWITVSNRELDRYLWLYGCCATTWHRLVSREMGKPSSGPRRSFGSRSGSSASIGAPRLASTSIGCQPMLRPRSSGQSAAGPLHPSTVHDRLPACRSPWA